MKKAIVQDTVTEYLEVIFVQHDAGPGSGMAVEDEAFGIVDQLVPKEGEKVFVKTIKNTQE